MARTPTPIAFLPSLTIGGVREQMQYLADEGRVIYSTKDGKDRKVFDVPESLAAMRSLVPNPGEQMVHAPPACGYDAMGGSFHTAFPDNTSSGDPDYS